MTMMIMMTMTMTMVYGGVESGCERKIEINEREGKGDAKRQDVLLKDLHAGVGFTTCDHVHKPLPQQSIGGCFRCI